ncbi:lipopolysaccharide biosynthesis protein [Ruoffia sp. FAM 26254]|uniref:lipopolysaccharide biosynthesis protein n=1 Tax=Ruoffia sp. FAM 26254 TaxID=3259518 RepID=UPI00388AF072
MKKYFKSKLVRNIMQLTAGSVVAQFITLAVSPISTRIFSPDELGIYTLLLSVVTIFGPILSARYDVMIVSADDEKETHELILGSILIGSISIVLITLGYSVYLMNNEELFNSIGWYAYIVVFILIITGMINILTYYNNRFQQYKLISVAQVIRVFAQNISMIIFGILQFGSIGLLLSQLFGLLFGIFRQAKYLLENFNALKSIKFKEVISTLKKYKDQPFFSTPAHLINASSYSILNFIIEFLYGFEVLGFYSISFRLLGLPLNIISVNLSKIFFQEASEEQRNSGGYTKSFLKFFKILFFLAVPMVIGLMLFSPYLFELFFGKGWNVSGRYVQILAPMYGVRFIVSALSPALIISRKQKMELFMQGAFIVSALLIFYSSTLLALKIELFLTGISIFYTMIYLGFLLVIYRLSRQNKVSI